MNQPIPSPSGTPIQVPGFEIDLSRDELRTSRGHCVSLRPRSFAVLRMLAENVGRLVTKDEIIASVWDDAVVTEDSLTHCIADIRRAISDNERKIVRTVPRRGYTLVGEPERSAAGRPGKQHPESPHTQSMPALNRHAADATAPVTRYTKSGDCHIAYQVTGNGPVDLVFVQGYVTNLEMEWEEARSARFYERLGSFSRLIRLDKRGTGLSDRVSRLPTLEERMDDVRAVMDAVGSKKAVLMGLSEGGPMSILFSATYPQRVVSLVLYGAMARMAWAPDHPWGLTSERLALALKNMEENWGRGNSVDLFAPTLASNSEYRNWAARRDRAGASPGAATAILRMIYEIDVRHVLPAIRIPTLVLHRTGDRAVPVEHGRYIAKAIPNAKYVELEGPDHAPWVGNTDAVFETIQSFVGSTPEPGPDRVLVTILALTSKSHQARPEKSVFSGPLKDAVRQRVEQCGGRALDNKNNNSFLAAFDGPTRAVKCGREIVDAFKSSAPGLRAGIHTGECYVSQHRLNGIALQAATEIAADASAGQVLVSSTVRDLVAGSNLQFQHRGTRVFDSMPEELSLLALIS